MIMRFVAFFALVATLLFSSYSLADEPAPGKVDLPAAAIAEIAKIKQKYLEYKYKATESALGKPLCSAVIDQDAAQRVEIAYAALKYINGDYDKTLRNVKIGGFDLRRPRRAEGAQPSLFGGDTPISLVRFDGNTAEEKLLTLAELVQALQEKQTKSTYVLSNSRLILENADFHMDCWDKVTGVSHGPLEAQKSYISFNYEPLQEGFDGRMISTLDDSCFYCVNAKEVEILECKNIKRRNAELLTAKGKMNEQCIAGTRTPMKAGQEMKFFGLRTELTNAYFLGELDRQILVHN